MFKVSLQPFFWATVSARLIGDLGAAPAADFTVKFKRLGQEEVQQLIAKINAKQINDQGVIDLVLLDWGPEIVGDDDQKLPFTPENVAKVCDVYGVRAAIVRKFLDTYLQEPEALEPAKNSAPQSATTS